MAIESTYKSLLGTQRKRRKKQERNDMLIQAGTLATNLYQSKLNEQAEDFFNRSEVANQRIKYQEGRDLYDNKIKKLYDQGTAYVGGHGEYLVANQARQIAQERIYANMDEENVFDPDDLGSAITSYSRELVYGKKGEDGTISEESKKQGMLYRLEQAYNSGKNLASMDKYDEYVSNRAALPENVGGALMNKLVRGKSRTDIETDALNRVVNENSFVKDSEAFVALSKSFDAGLSVKDSEKLASQVEKYTKGIRMQPNEVRGEPVLVTAKRYGDDGKAYEWTYYRTKVTNRQDGTVRYIESANTTDDFSAKIFKNEVVNVTTQGPLEKVANPITGIVEERAKNIVTNIGGNIIAQNSRVVNSENSSRVLSRIAADTEFDDKKIDAAGQAVEDVLFKLDNDSSLRDAFEPYMTRLSGEDEDKAAAKRKAFNYNVARVTGAIELQYGIPQNLARRLSAVIALENVKYNRDSPDDSKNYQGANLVAAKDINGLRVFEALNYLHMNDPELDLTELGKGDVLGKLTSELITPEQLIRFKGKSGQGTKGAIFDPQSRKYYIDNMSRQEGDDNLYNNRLALVLRGPNAGKTVRQIILESAYGPQQIEIEKERLRRLDDSDAVKGMRGIY